MPEAENTDAGWHLLDGVEFGLIIEAATEGASATARIEGDRFTLQSSDGAEPFEGAVSAAALQLAILAGLGPRPRPVAEAPVLLADTVETADRAGLLAAWAPDDLEGTPLGSEQVVVWTAWAAWPDPDDASESAVLRSFMVADAGPQGIALVDLDDDGVIVRPCSSTDVWFALAGLLPYPVELQSNVAVD